MSDLTPNFTQIPNVIFDHWMAILKPSEFTVLMCLCRKIYGWHKTSDFISKSQIMRLTGLTKNTVLNAIKALIDHGLVEQAPYCDERGYHPNEYKLNVKKPEDDKYQYKERRSEFDRGGSKNEPGVVQKMNQGCVESCKENSSAYTTDNKYKKERLPKKKSSDRQKLTASPGADFSFSKDERKFIGITDEDRSAWKIAYPSIDIDQQIAAAEQWLLSNPSKAGKKRWRKFLTGWLNRSNETAENRAAYRVAQTTEPGKLRGRTNGDYDNAW